MFCIDFPAYDFKFKEADNRKLIFDPFRKKWVLFTPEEWVRQNVLQYLVQVMHFPAKLMAVEKEIRLGEIVKRFDILVYNYDHTPWLMVECKSQEVELNENVWYQLLTYNMSVPVPFLIITNGNHCMVLENRLGKLFEWSQFPALPQRQ